MTNVKNNDEIVISLRNVTKNFGNFTAVSNVSLDIKKGEIIGFLGPNGAGKSTTMKMLARLLLPTEGEIWIRGNGELQLLTRKNKDHLLDNLGFLIENPAFYGHMTPRQILSYFAELKGYPKANIASRVEEIVELVGLTAWIDKKLGTFSKGMRQKIGIISAIVHDPSIVVLDEPQTGLDPKARREIRGLIKHLKFKGKTIFLSSHLLYEVSEVADRIGIIYNGQLIALDTLHNLESLAKRSVLQVELLGSQVEVIERVKEITEIVGTLTGLDNGANAVTYNGDMDVFEVLFDGNPEKQVAIFNALSQSDMKILGIAVPRTNLLEDLYLQYISEHGTDRSDLPMEPSKPQLQRSRS